MGLRRFAADELYLTEQDARMVLRFYFGDQVVLPSALSLEDIGFGQALLLEGIDASYAMGYVQIVFDSFYMKVPGSFDSVKEMVKGFCKKAAKQWFRHAAGQDLKDPKIYNAVRARVKSNFRSIWEIRMATGELTY